MTVQVEPGVWDQRALPGSQLGPGQGPALSGSQLGPGPALPGSQLGPRPALVRSCETVYIRGWWNIQVIAHIKFKIFIKNCIQHLLNDIMCSKCIGFTY